MLPDHFPEWQKKNEQENQQRESERRERKKLRAQKVRAEKVLAEKRPPKESIDRRPESEFEDLYRGVEKTCVRYVEKQEQAPQSEATPIDTEPA